MSLATPSPTIRASRLSPTFSFYVARYYLNWFGGFFCGVVGVVLLITLVDLLDRLKTKNIGFWPVLKLAFLKAPHFSQEALPFVILFAAIASFWRLTRSHELLVSRSAGVSIWQTLVPVLTVAALLGFISVGALNPLSTSLLKRADETEAGYRGKDESLFAVSSGGLWLRQPDEAGQTVINAEKSDSTKLSFENVVVFQFDLDHKLLRRIDAARAVLKPGKWILSEVWVSELLQQSVKQDELILPTSLTFEKIQDSFASPSTLSFWDLPDFISLLERAGFSALRHKLQYHRLLAVPLLLAAMVLIAASFSLRPQRRGWVGAMILVGVLTGFLLYFLSNFVFALGLSGKIPVVMAAWTPTVVSLLAGFALLLHLEDG